MAMKTVYSKRNLTLGLGTSAPQLKVGKNENIPEELLQGWYIPALLASGDISIEDQKPAIYNHGNVKEVEVIIESNEIVKEPTEEIENTEEEKTEEPEKSILKRKIRRK
jgi:hypothetical protein